MDSTSKNSGAGKKLNGLVSVHLVTFLTGFTFLIYEVSFNRLLSLILGTTVTAATIILASFMAGLGTGAYFWGKIGNARKSSGQLLAILLAGLAIFSFLNYFLITRAIPLIYSLLSGSAISATMTELLVFVFASILLYIPSFLMGGIFPIVSKIATQTTGSIASTLGRLYALETLGSALGGLATGFLFLGTLGQWKTILLAVTVNLMMAIWLIATRQHNRETDESAIDSSLSEPQKSAAKKSHHSTAVDLTALRRTALVGAFACGFCILSLQVVWFRIFRIYMTNTSYTFALIASMAILGLFAGSAAFKRWGQSIVDHRRAMLNVVLLMGVSTALGLLLLIYLPEVLMFPFQAALVNPLVRVLALPFVASLLVVFPPAIFSGFAFPLACRMYTTDRANISKDVGLVLMVNTAGSVVGPIAAALVMIPLLGATMSIVLVIALLSATAIFIVHSKKRASGHLGLLRPTYRHILIVVTVVLAAVILVRPEIRILPPSFARFDREVLFYRESVEGTLSVGKDRDTRSQSKYTFVNNSAVIGSTYDAIKIVKMVGHFPFLLGLDCKNILVIGFGIGVTTSAIASHPKVEQIECVELVEGLRDAAVYYRDLNHNVVEDPRLKIISGDGRHYLQRTSKKYDLISCDPTHPILGSGNLYTRDYFSLCREHLNPGGMVSQYLPLHKLRTKDLLGIIATFHSEFPHCTVWLGHYHAMLLGSLEPIRIDFDQWASNISNMEEDQHFYSNPYHLAATLSLDGSAIERLAAAESSKINTDDLSYTEFFSPDCLGQDNISKNLRFLMDNKIEIGAIFENIPSKERMDQFVTGNQLLTESLFHKLRGERQLALKALHRACQENPEDQEYPFLIKLDY